MSTHSKLKALHSASTFSLFLQIKKRTRARSRTRTSEVTHYFSNLTFFYTISSELLILQQRIGHCRISLVKKNRMIRNFAPPQKKKTISKFDPIWGHRSNHVNEKPEIYIPQVSTPISNTPKSVLQLSRQSVGLRVVGSRVPVRRFRGSRRDECLLFMSLLAGMVRLVTGRSQAKSVRGPAVRGYVRKR